MRLEDKKVSSTNVLLKAIKKIWFDFIWSDLIWFDLIWFEEEEEEEEEEADKDFTYPR